MGFIRRMENALARFMYGRNGVDRLNQALLAACVLLSVLAALIGGPARSIVWEVARWLLAAVVVFRTLSRNLARRREENRRWTGLIRRAASGWAAARARHADKDHKYFTCKDCGAVCRVPAGKGKIVITCPKCGARMQART